MPKYNITYYRTVAYYTTVEVEADTPEDAIDEGYHLAKDSNDYEASDDWLTKPELTEIEEIGGEKASCWPKRG